MNATNKSLPQQDPMLRDLRRMIAETGEASVSYGINQDGSTELSIKTSGNGISDKTKEMLLAFAGGSA